MSRRLITRREVLSIFNGTPSRRDVPNRQPSRIAAPVNPDQEDCPICLEPLASGDVYVTLGCGHRFHAHCAFHGCQYVQSPTSRVVHTSRCPMCRAPYSVSIEARRRG